MTTPKDSRPFDLNLAKAGHNLVTRDGRQAKFLMHVEESTQTEEKFIALVNGRVLLFSEIGEMWPKEDSPEDLFLAPLGYCEGNPVFFGDILIGKDSNRSYAGMEFIVKIGHDTFEAFQWPKPAHVVKTRMKYTELHEAYRDDCRESDPSWHSVCAINLANAAIARSIADGDVIPAAVVNELMQRVSEYPTCVAIPEFDRYLEGLKK